MLQVQQHRFVWHRNPNFIAPVNISSSLRLSNISRQFLEHNILFLISIRLVAVQSVVKGIPICLWIKSFIDLDPDYYCHSVPSCCIGSVAKPARHLVTQNKFFCVYKPYKESISKEMNANNNLNLHLHDQMSGWLRYCIGCMYVRYTIYSYI